MGKFDGFIDEVARHRIRKAECHVCILLKKLDFEAKVQVEGALAREELSSSAIRKALIKRDVEPLPSQWSLNRHRRQECRERRDES